MINNINISSDSNNDIKDDAIRTKKRVAILFFGLTRSLRKIYDNLKTNLFDELTNNGYDFDIFIHTYKLKNPYINKWSGENISNYDNESYKILNPKEYILENQDEVEKKLRISRYFSKLGNWKGCANSIYMKCYLVRNMVLALYSKKMVTKLFSKYSDDYDYVIITRPDQKFNNKINIESLNLLNNNNIIIPLQHCYFGLNDRTCIAKPNIAKIYGNAFDMLLQYSKMKSIISEVYLKDYITAHKIDVIFSPLKSHLVRCK
jgi:hypothetical protein